MDEGAVIRAIFELEPEREPFDMREVIVELTSITTSALTLYFLIDRITTPAVGIKKFNSTHLSKYL